MRVCRVMRTYPRKGNPGPGIPGYELAKWIVEPTLYITRRRSLEPIDVPNHVDLRQVSFPDPLEMPTSKAGAVVGACVKLAAYSMFFAGSLNQMRRWEPDVLHVHSLPGLLHGAIGSRLLKKPWVFTFHGTELRRAIRPPLRNLIARADHLFYVSPHMDATLARHFPDQPRTMTPSGVDTELFKPPVESTREPVLVTIGRFNWQKGYDVLAAALPSVFQQCPELRLVMVGRGPLEADITAQLKAKGVWERVQIVPQLERAELASLFERSAMMLLPSITEGFPKVILEAMATGTPVVSSDVGCCAQVLGTAGVIVPPKEPGLLAEAIVSLWKDDARRRAMSEQAPRLAEAYSWQKTASTVHEIFTTLVEGRSAARPTPKSP